MAYPSLFNTLVILSATLALLTPSLAYNILYAGERLTTGQSLTEGNLRFIMQDDCNLVLYDGGAVWASGTWKKGVNCYLQMQRDGNLVIYTGNRPIWASQTYRGGSANYVLVLQRDRNVVLYGPALWATGTNRFGTANVTIAANSNNATIAANSTEPVVIASGKISMVTDIGK